MLYNALTPVWECALLYWMKTYKGPIPVCSRFVETISPLSSYRHLVILEIYKCISYQSILIYCVTHCIELDDALPKLHKHYETEEYFSKLIQLWRSKDFTDIVFIFHFMPDMQSRCVETF